MVIGQQAESFGPASLLRKLKKELPQSEWLAEGSGNPKNKVDMPDHVKAVLAYLEKNPDDLKRPIGEVFFEGLQAAYPCP